VTIRERMRVKGEIHTLTAQQRISAYIISALPFVVMAVLFVINRPYMMKLFDPGVTRCLAAGAAGG
jgi:tight adherence protein B